MKAILVIDMPEECLKCQMLNGNDECILQDEDASFNAETWDDLRRGCPLRELPEYMKGNPTKNYNQMYKAGYNACLDDILEN